MDGRVIPAIVLLACGGGASEGQLRTRASFDMSCAQNQLQVVQIDDTTRGVMGCGRRHTYVQDCEREGAFGWSAGCTWILNKTAEAK